MNKPMNKTRISTILAMLLGAASMFLLAASVLADDSSYRVTPGAAAVTPDSTGSADASFFRHKPQRHWRVRCNRGDSLTRVLRRARPNDTIKFYGTCYESIVIDTDNLSIRGVNGAVIDGSHAPSEAVVLIDGARGLSLADFTVQNGADQGILATHQAQALLHNLVSRNNATVGLAVDRSHLDIEDLVLDDNTSGGMDAFTGSTVVAKGRLSAQRNGGDGLVANGKTFLELRGANVIASDNRGSGVSIINDSRLQVFSFPEAQGSTINADNNGFAGVGLLGSEMGVVGSQFFGSGANVISASNNAIFGFFMPAGAILSPHATGRFVAQGNGVGMLLEDGASALIVGGLELTQNGAGLSAHGAGTLTLVSVPPNPSRVDANQIDIDIGFGTRLTSDGLAYTSLACDPSVLVRGLECP